MNKKTILAVNLIVGIFLGTMGASASGVILYNNGIGQRSNDAINFGFQICNSGSKDLTQSVPVLVSANNKAVATKSVYPIARGACAYSYLPYSKFAMVGGQFYAIKVTIDPKHAFISNINNKTVYAMIEVPEATSISNVPQTPSPSAESQLASMIAALRALTLKINQLFTNQSRN